MSFAEPLWFFALLLVPLLAGLYWRGENRSRERLAKFVATRLQARLVSGANPGRRAFRFALLLLGLACAITALAGPQLGYADRSVKRIGRDVLIAIDTSKSMLANDTAPDRLTRSRLAADDLLDALPGDRAGLIAFAGGAFLQAPLTIDYSAVRDSLNALDTNVIPQGGTDISGAIRAAVDAFGKSESANRCLVIFSDGEDLTDDAVKTAQSVAGKIRIFTVGVGTAEGSLIPIPSAAGGTDFVKDQDGNFVKSHLDETRLRQIAEATGGFSLHLGDSLADMQRLVRDGIGGVAAKEIDARLSRQPIERYQWPLGAALLLLVLAYLIPESRNRAPLTRGQTAAPAAAALLLMLGISAPAAQQSDPMNLYREGKYGDAYQAFQQYLAKRPQSPELHFNAGDSAFQAKDYQKAIEGFTNAMQTGAQLGTASEYNLSSALFQRGAAQKEDGAKKKDWKNALQHLDSVLKTEPENADAKFNRNVIQKALEDLEKPQPSPPPKQDQKKEDDGKKKSQPPSGGGGKDQPKSDEKSDGKSDQDKQDKNSDSQPGEQQKQDQNDGQDGKEKQPSQAQNGQPSASPSPSADKNESAQNQPPQGSPSASPTPARDGQIQSADHGKPEGSPSPGEGSATSSGAAPSEAAPPPGEMTPQQAAMLLNSLKGDEKNVQLNEHRPTGPVLKDW